MKNRKIIGIILLFIGLLLLISTNFVAIRNEPQIEGILKMFYGILGTILILITILLMTIKKKTPKNSIIMQEKEVLMTNLQLGQISGKSYCSSCGAEILDKTGAFCSKCGAPFK